MYRIEARKISFLLNFLSTGCVGTMRRSSANAPDTFCCRQRSLELVKTFLATKTRGGPKGTRRFEVEPEIAIAELEDGVGEDAP